MNVDFTKGDSGLIPAVIQDSKTRQVLMLGFMNQEALDKTQKDGKVTFFSRSKGRLWTKGETSGNYLNLVSIKEDCDSDTLLIRVNPEGPVCHTGTDTCWGEENNPGAIDVISDLAEVIKDRKENPVEGSYTNKLFERGINKIAQKVGEEAVELVIEAKDNNSERFLNEAADLMYHYLVLLEEKGFSLEDVSKVLAVRAKK